MGVMVNSAGNSALGKGLLIAFHIIRGDNVCPMENNFLFEKYPWMYIQAWSLRSEDENKISDTQGDVKKELMNFIDSGIFNIGREVMMEALGVSA
ncbi:MAG: hypothetical protein LBC82_07285 [Oscillospiraceae bacterium]|jgi:hypothetical protein|nr:hypothetical protein [Oscillospiraceae bacterium]